MAQESIIMTTVLAAAIIGTGLFIGMRSDNSVNPRKITVSGECLSTVKQDMTAVTIRFVVVDTDAGKSVNIARAAYEDISKRIRAINDDTMKLNTIRFDSYEKTEWSHSENKSIKLGTETNIELEVSSENRNVIEDILGFATGAQYTEVQGLRMFTSPKTMKPALESCIKVAVENAREKAATVADADGRRLGKMISAEYSRTVGNGGNPRPMMMKAMYNAASFNAATGTPELFSSDSDISVTVNAEFEIR